MKKAVTVLEITIVLTIIIVLAAAVIPLFNSSSGDNTAKIAKANADLNMIRSAIQKFEYDTGTMVPKNQNAGLNVNDPYCLADNKTAYCAALKGWKGPYLIWQNDPWGTPYRICGDTAVGNEERKVHSWGPDKGEDICEPDDICQWARGEPPY